MENQLDEFFKDLPAQDKQIVDVFNENKTPEEIPAKDDSEVETTEARKNRRHRRLEDQLQKERESNISLNERIKFMSEFGNQKPASTEMPAEWIALYGDTPEAEKAWKVQEKLFDNYKNQAKEEALKEFESKQETTIREQKEAEALIDSELENLEDTYNVDLTSDSPAARKARREVLELVQKLSPKDSNGNITGYADFEATFEQYQAGKVKPDASRNKEIASRSMQRSSPGGNTASQSTPGFGGWRRDYGLE